MHIVLLGTAAGGGFPQWNCWCAGCRAARSEPARAKPRTQSSIAVSADGATWFLCNASPDVRAQLSQLGAEPPTGRSRWSPVEGVVLTDAELDHTAGLLLLREGGTLDVYAMPEALGVLEYDSAILPTVRAFADVRATPLEVTRETPLRTRAGAHAGLTVEPIRVVGGAPRFAREDRAAAGRAHAVALVIHDTARNVRAAYVPGCGSVNDALREQLCECDAVFLDGTFWSADELGDVTGASTGAATRDHLPMSGNDGSLAWLSSLRAPLKVYVHMNNTNPVLLEDSRERVMVRERGVIVGEDGMRFSL